MECVKISMKKGLSWLQTWLTFCSYFSLWEAQNQIMSDLTGGMGLHCSLLNLILLQTFQAPFDSVSCSLCLWLQFVQVTKEEWRGDMGFLFEFCHRHRHSQPIHFISYWDRQH